MTKLDYNFMAQTNTHIQQALEAERQLKWKKKAKILAVIVCAILLLGSLFLEVPH